MKKNAADTAGGTNISNKKESPFERHFKRGLFRVILCAFIIAALVSQAAFFPVTVHAQTDELAVSTGYQSPSGGKIQIQKTVLSRDDLVNNIGYEDTM